MLTDDARRRRPTYSSRPECPPSLPLKIVTVNSTHNLRLDLPKLCIYFKIMHNIVHIHVSFYKLLHFKNPGANIVTQTVETK